MGTRIARRRLDMGFTQAQVAEQAGVAKRTLERIEAGASAQMSNMIRILRVLDLLPGLDRMIPPELAGPIDLLKRREPPRPVRYRLVSDNENFRVTTTKTFGSIVWGC
jgi:transcriptional regulator with XRE-family HTH domain